MRRQVISRQLPSAFGREIVISDIHGDLQTYEKLLKACAYRPGEDRLILLGDLMEKGPENLALLHRIMEQCEHEEVYALMGNCDFIARNFLYGYRLEYIRSILLERPCSLIHEMIAKASLAPVDASTDMDQLAFSLRRLYRKELSFLNDLPQVIETPERIYVHAGLIDEKTYARDFRDVLTFPLFGLTEKVFSKLVVCGHMPVTEYCRQIGDFNPRYFPASHILSIDGGNIVKSNGQLNAVIFAKNTMETRSASRFPKVQVRCSSFPDNPAPFYLTWKDGQLQILETGVQQSLVFSAWLNRTFWIDNAFLHQNRGTDYTNYEMPLQAGEKVEVLQVYGRKAQIRKLGRLGWTWTSYLENRKMF